MKTVIKPPTITGYTYIGTKDAYIDLKPIKFTSKMLLVCVIVKVSTDPHEEPDILVPIYFNSPESPKLPGSFKLKDASYGTWAKEWCFYKYDVLPKYAHKNKVWQLVKDKADKMLIAWAASLE